MGQPARLLTAHVPALPRVPWLNGRRIGVVALFLYGVECIRRPNEYRLLDSLDLALHETGHLVFAPFGEFLAMLGGTLFQLIVPLAFVLYFWRREERFSSAIVLFLVAQNCWNIARYIADARAQELPLVGGGEHDWAYLLGTLGWLRHDQTLSTAVTVVGFLLFATSIWFGWLYGGDAGKAQRTDTTSTKDG